MNDDLKDILSHLNPDINQEVLMQYLQGKLTSQQQHELEKQMMDSEFDTDALEGLQDFSDKKKINALVEQLNQDLKNKTGKKKRSRKSLPLKLDPWVVIAIILILLLVVIGFILVHQQIKQS